ncbi:sulfotransferase 1A1-like [Patiria miniata]|uniref:Sulfotransferase domain-containing protein n=1 Tax=Patiria miniata TaxID=46514 RepID=A0A914A3Q6_PATMI|nr:sulfotransferase 1A1-like [Patiria miniata]
MNRIDGINWPWMVTQECLDAMKSYDVSEDDVWVVSHPKSGTHWTAEMVHMILAGGREENINRPEHWSRPPEFDYSRSDMPPIFERRTSPHYKEIQKWPAPRVIMTHLTEERMPSQIYQGKGKVVFVIRNPKDVAVSMWHYVKPWKFDPNLEDWDYFFQKYLNGETVYGSWFDHILDFWNKHRHDNNFLFIKYEDMKQDIKTAVTQIAHFLNKPLSEDAINNICKSCSMGDMSQRFQGRSTDEDPRDEPANISVGQVFRKGIVGDWKTKFTVAQNEALDEIFREKMAGSGLKIQFE